MALSYQDAYTQIKNLENNGTQLPLPAPTDAIVVGSIDAQTGAFTFAVPTFQQTITSPVGANPNIDKPSPPIVNTVGVVATNCVNLTLVFEVTNVPIVAKATSAVSRKRVADANIAASGAGVEFGSTGNVTVTGFPSAGTQGSRILLNAGLAASSFITDSPNVTPGVGDIFPLTITVNGQQAVLHIAIFRPPILGLGAFTIPALPAAIVFAPPQGQLAKNSNTFTDKVTITNTTTVSVSTQNSTKEVQAYTIAQLVGDVAGLYTQLGGLLSGLQSLQTTAGKPASLFAVISGPPGGGQLTAVGSSGTPGTSPTLADVLKAYGSGWSVASDILGGFGDQGANSETSSITTQTNNSFAVAVAYSDTYGSASGAGPGEGDRFVYLRNVKAVWANVNGNVSLSVLGYDGVYAYPASTLIADLQALSSRGTTKTLLDATTIELMLELDPYYVLSKRKVSPVIHPPLIGSPRFSPLTPLNRGGGGTAGTGDVFSLANETIADTSTSTSNQTINVSDYKPGWIDVLLGADNTETTTTLTATNTLASDQKQDEAITNTVTMYTSSDPSDTYAIQMWFDNLFQTIVPVPANSPVLQGVTVVGVMGGTTEPAATAT
jgi:hypothetical protein